MSKKIAARIIKQDKVIEYKGSSQISDPFSEIYSSEGLLEPPYNPLYLAQLGETSNILRPLIDAYKTNITGFGYSFRWLIDMESEEIAEEIRERAKKEWLALEFFYNHCNFDQTFTSLTKKFIADRETIGWGCLEVIPRGDGKPGGFEYIPAHTIRLTKLDPQPQRIPITTIGINGEPVRITYTKKFRRFCQMTEENGRRVWFKEFGDPRRLSKTTGKFEYEMGGEKIPPEDLANSIIYDAISVSYTPYGIPRWMGTLIGTLGSRKAEELNLRYFTQGKHIPMAVLVKNGSLTESSVETLQEYANQMRGVENSHGFLVLEADASSDELDTFDGKAPSTVDIKLQPLTQILQQDALFQEYDKSNRDKMRASLRLPPVYTGETRDYTRATADTARSIAEEQIFNPERIELAEKFNKLLNFHLNIRYVGLYFKSPDLSNKKELAEALNPYIRAGALTPNMLISSVSDLLGIEFEQIREDWGNKPLQLAIEEIRRGVDVGSSAGKKKAPSVVDHSIKVGEEGELEDPKDIP